MAALLSRLRTKGHIPDVDIYTAGFGNTVSELYDRTARFTQRKDPNLRLRDLELLPLPPGDFKKGPYLRNPSIILTSSGMMATGTLSYRLAEVMLPNVKHGIFFVGYVDPNMPGYQILTSKRGHHFKLNPNTPEIFPQCQIERFHFSAHSNRRSLLRLVGQLNPQMVILVHGECGAEGWMRETIKIRYPHLQVEIAKKGLEIQI